METPLKKIKKAKLHDSGKLDVGVEVMLDENGKKDKDGRESDDICHPDLIQAFKDLDIHLATICEQGNFTDYEDDPKSLDIYHTTGFTIAGEGDHEGIVLTGQRKLAGNQVLNLNTPFVKFHPDHCHYTYIGSLREALHKAISEVDMYYHKTKLAPKVQMELSFEGSQDPLEEEHDDEAIAAKKTKQIARKLKKDLDKSGMKLAASN